MANERIKIEENVRPHLIITDPCTFFIFEFSGKVSVGRYPVALERAQFG